MARAGDANLRQINGRLYELLEPTLLGCLDNLFVRVSIGLKQDGVAELLITRQYPQGLMNSQQMLIIQLLRQPSVNQIRHQTDVSLVEF